MTRRPYLQLAVLLAALLVVAGCGSSSKKTSSTGGASTTAPSTTAPTTSAPSTTSTPPGGAVGGQKAVAACKSSIDRSPQLTSSDKAELKKVCAKAASGDVQAARKAAADVCVKVAERAIPAGSARDQAVAACEKTAQ